MMKKNILFILNDLNMGGAETSLITFLQEFDYSKYNVSLQLLKKEGFLMKKLPSEVHLLTAPESIALFEKPFFQLVKDFKIKLIIARLVYKFWSIFENNRSIIDQKLWKSLARTIPKNKNKYDVAFSFLENRPNFYCIDKVDATIKIGSIRNDYKKMGMSVKYDKPYFDKFNLIIVNSIANEMSLKEIFPEYSYKIKILQNIFSVENINLLANEHIKLQKADLTIVTVGRLFPEKNYSLAIDSLKLLRNKGIDAVWYVLGEGNQRTQLEKQIDTNGVSNYFFLLGHINNPYPYIFIADIYVHTSKYEGKSRAIEEAKILHKPIVVTDFPSVTEQITHNKTGLIVESNPDAMLKGILTIYNNKEISKNLVHNLSQIEWKTNNKMDNFYNIINF